LKLIAIGIILILIAVVLSGCNESNNSTTDIKNRFIGTWEYVNTEFFTARYTFFENGTAVQNNSNMYYLNWYKYEIRNGKLCLEFIKTKVSGCVTYKFSEDYTLLTWESVDNPGHPETYRKIS
jgi:predicted small secreted protein